MCSSANPTQESLQKSQAAFTSTLQDSFKSAFAANQSILGNLTQKLTAAIANPQGYTPAEMAALRTGAMDTNATATANATKAAAAYNATHGGVDLGSGVASQIQGSIQSAGARDLADKQNQITIADAERKQQNYWNAIQGLTTVGAAYNPTGYASTETSSANATTSASQAVSAEQQQSWNNAFGIVKGVSGLVMGGLTGLPSFGGSNTSIMPSSGGGGGPDQNGFIPGV